MQTQCQNSETRADRGLRVKEVAQMIGCSVSTIWRFTRQGLLKNKKLGGVTIWTESEVQKFLRGEVDAGQ